MKWMKSELIDQTKRDIDNHRMQKKTRPKSSKIDMKFRVIETRWPEDWAESQKNVSLLKN